MKTAIAAVLAFTSCMAVAQPRSPVSPEVRALYNETNHKAVIAAVDEWLVRPDLSLLEKFAKVRALAETGNYRAQTLLVEAYQLRCTLDRNALCGAVAQDMNEAQKWIYELARTDRPEVPYFEKSRPQALLAWDHYRAAAPKYSLDNENCKSALIYAEQSYTNGDRCVSMLMTLMYRLEHCVEKNQINLKTWHERTFGCPRY